MLGSIRFSKYLRYYFCRAKFINVAYGTNAVLNASNVPMGELSLGSTSGDCDGKITGFQINPQNGGALINVGDGQTFCESDFTQDIRIRALVSGSHESLVFTISGGADQYNVENQETYDSKQFWANPGSYTITAQLYSGDDGSGTLCDERTLTIHVDDCKPAECSGRITGFRINPQNGGDLINVANGDSFCESDFTGDIKIRASVEGDHESVVFTVSGGANSENTDNKANYQTNQFWASPGNYTITARLYSGDNGSGTLCDEQTITFTVDDCKQESCTGKITGFKINDENGAGLSDVANGDTFCESDFIGDIRIRALVEGAHESVVFTVSGGADRHNVDNSKAYETDKFWPSPGTYTITAKLYSGDDGSGTLCDERTLTIHVDDCKPAECSGRITGFRINPQNGGDLINVANGDSFCESDFTGDIKIRASVEGDHESVVFTVSGGANSENTDNKANYQTNQFWASPGSYTITARLYSGDDGSGTLCDEQTITFTVDDCKPAECTGKITGFKINDENGAGLSDVANGDTFCESDFIGDIRIRALVEGAHESLVFTISGSTDSDNVENGEPYDSRKFWPNPGSYTITARLYSGHDGEGTLCDERSITINVDDCTDDCTPPISEICTAPIVPIEVCPEFCLEGTYEITEARTQYNSSLTIDGTCITYRSLPGFKGNEQIDITACNNAGKCETTWIKVKVSSECENACKAKAGRLAAVDKNVCTEEAIEVTISSQSTVPDGFDVLYVLTTGEELTIVGVNDEPTFDRLEIGTYKIHTLVYNPTTLDLGIVEVGVTTGYDVHQLLQQGGGIICGALRLNGPNFKVEDCSDIPEEPCNTEIQEVCVKQGDRVEICPEFCLGDNIWIEWIKNTSDNSTRILEERCIRYRASDDKFTGVDQVRARACNTDGKCEEVYIEVSVSKDGDCNNEKPIANDDSAVTHAKTAVTIDVLANDSDPDGDDLSITSFTQGENGTVELVDGKLVYHPNKHFVGEDNFTYQICDTYHECATAKVWVTVEDGTAKTDAVKGATEDLGILKITPIPAKDMVQFNFTTNEEKVNINIFNLSGKLMSSKIIETSTTNNLYTLDISEYPAGIYLINLTSDKAAINGKFLKD